MSKINKLQKQLKKVLEEENKARKNAEYHSRQQETKDVKKIEKHQRKEQAYRKQLSNIRLEIKVAEGKIAEEKLIIEEKAYIKRLKNFLLPLKELIINLKELLEKEKFLEAIDEANGLYQFYDTQKQKLQEKDYQFIDQYLDFGSIGMRISVILEQIIRGKQARKNIGPGVDANLKAKAKMFNDRLIASLTDCISMIDNKLHPKKVKKEKVKKNQVKKEEPKKEPTFKSIEEGRIEWIKEEASKRKSPEERAKEQFLKWKKEQKEGK